MLILLAISSIVYAAYETNNDGLDFYNYPVYYVTPAIMAITFVDKLFVKNNFFFFHLFIYN